MASTETQDICRGELEISVPWDEVRSEIDKVLKAFRRQARIPGFRPGKAPDKVIMARYKDDVRGEVLETLVGKHFWKAADAEDYHVVGTPKINEVSFVDEQPLTFKAEFEILPDFELNDYKRIQAPFREPEVTDDEVSQELERLREQHASYKNVDPRPIEDGDIAVISLASAEVEGAPKINQEETTLTIGSENTLAGFNDALRGKSPDEEVDFEVTYPEDFGNEDLAGKTIPFHAKVKAIRVKELPELDDEFAGEVGDFQTLDELKSKIREEIEGYKRRRATDDAKEKIIDVLVERHSFPVPNLLVEQQISSRLERSARALAAQGIDPRQMPWDQMREGQREKAERDVRAGLLLERIGEVEAIEADEEEINAEVERFARQNQLTLAGARKQLAEDGTLDRIQTHLTNEKVINWLFDEAEKVEPPEEEAKAEDAEAAESGEAES